MRQSEDNPSVWSHQLPRFSPTFVSPVITNGGVGRKIRLSYEILFFSPIPREMIEAEEEVCVIRLSGLAIQESLGQRPASLSSGDTHL